MYPACASERGVQLHARPGGDPGCCGPRLNAKGLDDKPGHGLSSVVQQSAFARGAFRCEEEVGVGAEGARTVASASVAGFRICSVCDIQKEAFFVTAESPYERLRS